MKVRREQSHRALLVPVLLILAAAFLATSLSVGRTSNEISGAQTFQIANQQRCQWTEYVPAPYGVPTYHTLFCPTNAPRIAAGGCETEGSIKESSPVFNSAKDGWHCEGGFNGTLATSGQFGVTKASAYCCRQ